MKWSVDRRSGKHGYSLIKMVKENWLLRLGKCCIMFRWLEMVTRIRCLFVILACDALLGSP